ncbi:MAG: glycoside hydrolase family 3 C-terminal domain-containing protein [Promethearchaeota archaeon]
MEEKAALLAGRDWSTTPVERLGIPPMKMTDGPHGVGPHSSGGATCTYFPVGVCRASTWNPRLCREFGVALAGEVRSVGYHVILGPAVNLVRTPLCGRNFEYQSEDPFLNARLAVATVKGIQSQRVAACVKHFAANNQEHWRLWVNVHVDERVLRELYLPAFRASVEEADAWSLMACYNRVNGPFGCENAELIRRIAQREWGFRGFVVSDWGATNYTESAASCLNAGLSLEMPRPNRYVPEQVVAAVRAGEVPVETLDDAVRRLLRVMFLVGLFDHPGSSPAGARNVPEHHDLARRLATEGMVLLKNEGGVLPFDPGDVKAVAVLGPNADLRLAEGGGSSQVRPPHEVTPLEGITAAGKALGVQVESLEDPEEAGSADAAVVVVGLNHSNGNDCEGFDRESFDLPASHVELVKAVAGVVPRVVVVLVSGAPVSVVDWVDDVPGVVEAWYAGQEGGRALADLLFGRENFSGKLPVSFPKHLSDLSVHASPRRYPGEDDEDEGPQVYYEEGLFVGYRDLDAKGVEPAFPFGHGLSYASFRYESLSVSGPNDSSGDVDVSFTIFNDGLVPGKEVAQVYVSKADSEVPRPPKELKGFVKVALKPGEGRRVAVRLRRRDLAHFDVESGGWRVEPGAYRVLVGASSRDPRLSGEFNLR